MRFPRFLRHWFEKEGPAAAQPTECRHHQQHFLIAAALAEGDQSRFRMQPLGLILINPPVCSFVTVTRYASGFSGRGRIARKNTLLCPSQMHGGSASNTLYTIRYVQSGRSPLLPLNRATPKTRGRFRIFCPTRTPVVL